MINQAGLDLIKEFEGLELKSYKCLAGVWTIGYGATGPDIVEGLTWTKEQAEQRFIEDVGRFSHSIEEMVKIDLNDNQFSAIVSLAYNIGPGAFKSSTLLKLLNLGNLDKAALEFPKWNKVKNIPSLGLSRRRLAEQKLFLA
jgi:lysozyme